MQESVGLYFRVPPKIMASSIDIGRGLGRFLLQPPAQNKVSLRDQTRFYRLYPSGSWKPSRTETAQSPSATCCSA